MTWAEVMSLGARLPGVEPSTSWGTPALKVRGKMLVRLHPDGVSLVVPVGFDERELLVEADPEVFAVTDHYRGWPLMLARLDRLDPPTLSRLLEQAWREKAGKRLKATLERSGPGDGAEGNG